MLQLSRRLHVNCRHASKFLLQKKRSVSSFVVSEEVTEALSGSQGSKAVVALESTIISHGGLKYPRNLELALDLENVIREEGGIPATCAVLEGVPTIGLSKHQLDEIATRKDVVKASRRDLPYACGTGMNASTTVAATMILANAAGIRFFATGGIGGVHRGAEDTFDVSADLTELGKTPVVVVSSGVKSILDIPKTLEVLETHGVPVVSFKSDTFPEFFTHGTIPSPRRVDSEEEVARMVLAASHCFHEPLGTGMLCAVPNPSPYPDAAGLELCIQEALSQADNEGIKGAAITPYILAAIERKTAGDSLESNVALVMNNAKVATRIAVKHAQLTNNGLGGINRSSGGSSMIKRHFSNYAAINSRKDTRRNYQVSAQGRRGVVVVGGSAIDSISKITVPNTILHSSNPAVTRTGYGGVGRNIAERMGHIANHSRRASKEHQPMTISLVSVVADDAWGRALIQRLNGVGVDTSMVKTVSSSNDNANPPVSTATYTAIHGFDGDLVVSAGDFSILKHFNGTDLGKLLETDSLQSVAVVVIDGNFEPDVFRSLARAIDDCQRSSSASTGSRPLLAFEPTSDHKCTLPIDAGLGMKSVDIVKPNLSELVIMLERAGDSDGHMPKNDLETAKMHMKDGLAVPIDVVRSLASAMCEIMSSDIEPKGSVKKHVVVSMGAEGVVWAEAGPEGPLATHIPLGEFAVPPEAIVNTNGCGDAFCAGLLLDTASKGGELTRESIFEGFKQARMQILI